jgi:hypothetical protein
MVIYLPDKITLFKEAFPAACKRIIASEQDLQFYILYIELIEALRSNSLTSSYISKLEKELDTSEQKMKDALLKAAEEEWLLSWKMHKNHHKSFLIKKELILIKRMITHPGSQGLVSKILPDQLDSAFQQLETRFSLNNANKDSSFNKQMQILSKLTIRGDSTFEKRLHMQMAAETDPLSCWNRMRFLQKCWHFNEPPLNQKLIKGKWPSIKKAVWQLAWDISDKYILLQSKWNLNNNLAAGNSNDQFPKYSFQSEEYYSLRGSSYLSVEQQIHRKDFEGHLRSLQNHIYNQLLKQEELEETCVNQLSSNSEQLTVANKLRIDRENFITHHAKTYWSQDSVATLKTIFKDYKKKCSQSLQCGCTKWNEIIKKNQLDPRTTKAKKAFSGRPSKK